jgi:hypothetical protein
MSVSFIYVNGVLNLVLGGKVTQITSEHPSYGLVKKALATASEEEIMKMLDVKTAMSTFVEKESCGRATVSNGQVYFDNKPVHNTLAKRVLEFMQEGLPFSHLLKFMEHVSENPSYQSQQELFDFLEHRNLPITEDGCFLAYKAVREDWMDKYSGTISNRIGNIIREKRSQVDDNRDKGCSKGLHCGALDYVYQYGGHGDHLIIVKVNPKNVVSVPKDCSYQKLRCCEYEVIREFEGELTKPVYTTNGSQIESLSDQPMDWAFCDDNVEYDAYNDGYDSYNDGLDLADNPCDVNSQNYKDWDSGWCDACDDEEDDDWDNEDEDEDDYDEDEDCLTSNDVSVTRTDVQLPDSWGQIKVCGCGKKPSGQNYHNKRDSYGRFAPKK